MARDSGPLEPKLNKDERKALAARLRALLSAAPLDMSEMAASLAVEPEAVVIALRELRARNGGQLRSTIRLGHVCWWWQDRPKVGKEQKAGKPEKTASLPERAIPTEAEVGAESSLRKRDKKRTAEGGKNVVGKRKKDKK